MPSGKESWSMSAIKVLRDNHWKDDSEISLILCEGGCFKTRDEVFRKRCALGYRRKEDPAKEKTHVPRGWPQIEGDFEESDDRFWRLVLKEGIACGYIQITP